jgi:hypothetical protein
MSLPAVRFHLHRYPDEPECSWSEPSKCQNCECRYSLLADRPRIREWAREDVLELIDAMPSTCALELGNQGPHLLDETAAYLGIPRALVEQFETLALRKLSRLRELRKANWDSR